MLESPYRNIQLIRINIERYLNLLMSETDDAKRASIEKLLAEAERELWSVTGSKFRP